MTREEKLQEIVEYNPCRIERNAVLRYLLAIHRNDTEQIAYFESFGKSVRHIILNVRTYERGLIFGFIGKQFNEHGWLPPPAVPVHQLMVTVYVPSMDCPMWIVLNVSNLISSIIGNMPFIQPCSLNKNGVST